MRVPIVRPTTRGAVLLAVGVGLLVTAYVAREPSLVGVGVLLVGLVLVALAAAWLGLPRLRASRRVTPSQVEAGRPTNVELGLAARGVGVPALYRLDDRLPPSFGGAQALDVPMPARQPIRVAYQCRPLRRGRFRLDRLTVEATDLLGLAQRTTRLRADASVLVTPPVLPLSAARRQVSGTSGETPIPQTAISGPDDVLVRDYQPRDDVRRIHWPSTARAGHLMVRREEQAWDPTAWVVLDSRSAAHGGAQVTSASFEWLVTLAASVGAHLLDAGYVVSIADAGARTFSSRREHLQPRQAWLEHLVDSRLSPETGLGEATRMVSRETSGHLVVALLATLDAADAAQLVDTADANGGWVLLLDDAAGTSRVPAGGGHTDGGLDQGLRILAAHGWSVARTAPGTDPSGAWQRLGVRAAATGVWS